MLPYSFMSECGVREVKERVLCSTRAISMSLRCWPTVSSWCPHVDWFTSQLIEMRSAELFLALMRPDER
jgi:hypothetical protein